MWVYRGILPHFEVFTGCAEDHLLQDEAPDEGVEGEVGEPHDPRADALLAKGKYTYLALERNTRRRMYAFGSGEKEMYWPGWLVGCNVWPLPLPPRSNRLVKKGKIHP